MTDQDVVYSVVVYNLNSLREPYNIKSLFTQNYYYTLFIIIVDVKNQPSIYKARLLCPIGKRLPSV